MLKPLDMSGKLRSENPRYDVLCPTPAEVRHDNKSSYKGREQRAGKHSHAKYRDCHASSSIVKHVAEDSRDTLPQISTRKIVLL